MTPKTTTWLAMFGVLMVGLMLQFLPVRDIKDGDTTAQIRPIGLAIRIPTSVPAWTAKDEPLGPTEFMQSEVQRTLNYDDVLNRVYRQGERSFGIYVAYWSPGRMPVQKVASHTPDRCWTENGWKCDEMQFAESLEADGITLRPAQWRLFSPPRADGEKEYVIYWHLVGDQLYDYGNRFNARPDLVKWWRDTVAYAMAGSAAQYFVRVTSNRPFGELTADPSFQVVVKSLADLGLRESSKGK